MMLRLLVFCGGILCSNIGSVQSMYAQINRERVEHAVQGRVIDAATRTPLSTVHVFLARRLQGTTTDDEGFFEFDDIQPGYYEIAASIIGYESYRQEIEVTPGIELFLEIRLEPAVYELENVEVTGTRPKNWRKQYKRFHEHFLGKSGNAKKSVIVNEYALNFEETDAQFLATASEPLIIENRGLGYRITFILDQFLDDFATDRRYTSGSWYFEELEPASEKEKEEWFKHREVAFKGSLQHLLWSMVQQSVEEEGFAILRDRSEGRDHPELFLHHYHPLNVKDVLMPTDNRYTYRLRFADFIRVHYVRTGDKVKLFGKPSLPADQLSYIQLAGEEVTIHESGYLYAPSESISGEIVVFGYLATLGIADLLPQEYALIRTRY